jgi:hypothetical protein
LHHFQNVYSEIHTIIIKMCNLLGLQMPVVELFHPRYLFVMVFGVIFWVMFANGCYQSFGDIYKLLHALVPASIMLEYVGRVFNLFYRDYQKFASIIHEKTLGFYEKHENDPKYRQMLIKRMKESEFYLKLLVYCTILCFHIPLVYSFALFAVTGEKFLFLNNFLPWTDLNDTFGFFLNLCMMSMVMPITCFGLFVGDSLFVFYGCQVVPLCDILCSHLDEIGEGLMKLEKHKYCEELSELEQAIVGKNKQDMMKKLEEMFIDVIKEHREFDNFIETIIFYTEIPYFFSVTFNSLSIGICIVAFFKINMAMAFIGGE